MFLGMMNNPQVYILQKKLSITRRIICLRTLFSCQISISISYIKDYSNTYSSMIDFITGQSLSIFILIRQALRSLHLTKQAPEGPLFTQI